MRPSLCFCASVFGAFAFLPTLAHGQSTDGYHAIQVLPVVVDTSAYATRIHLRNPRSASTGIMVNARYFPAAGTSQQAPLDCGTMKKSIYANLRELCPALAPGNQFGMLVLTQTGAQKSGASATTDIVPFAVYARVSNPAEIGFSVESFPAHAFTSARTVVTGLRRRAATATSPAIQSNCFVGILPEVSPAAPVVTRVDFQVNDNTISIHLGNGSVDLLPGQFVRLLDVFSAAGAGFQDYEDARVEFIETGDGEPGLVTFCTVQDNSSFGADFRIGKQEEGTSQALPGGLFLGAQDDHVLRDTTVGASVSLSSGPGVASALPFQLPVGHNAATHLFYFRHPDFVQCELIDPATGVRATPGYGLEMRLLASDGITVIAGGNDVQGFSRVYLGDKADRDEGSNSRYTLEVESTVSLAAPRPYQLHCQSGSGHSLGELLRSGAGDRF